MTTISTKGQVTIPESIRQTLGIKPGEKVAFSIKNQAKREVSLKVIKQLSFDELGGSLHQKGMKYVPLSEVRKTLAKNQSNESWV